MADFHLPDFTDGGPPVRIVERASGVWRVMLSPEAAEALGIADDDLRLFMGAGGRAAAQAFAAVLLRQLTGGGR